ncbi:phosphatidylcholine synthase [Breoghania corrubedonensis]|uniref:Phosphatidylcholine synthase n=1 Tax=Breoghania corrubedonensis TaxID=665038 RepID=A0A2T5V8N8_9HYPH|nr:CDP-alcohol phosphatidyltransferase family protein [Breoghania corrubedonensis]PTW60126.1 phosphatidylcholine synthase [Breoghania corrubedonensis]
MATQPREETATGGRSTWLAFAVHILTASGALWALLAMVAAADGDWPMMFAWLGVALVVDGIDGPLARAANVTERLPTWSGAALDFVIDYATYVLLPAFAIATAGLMSTPYNLIAAGLVVVSGALYFAYDGMKLPDNCFRGFPVTWNMLVFVIFAFPVLQAYSLVIVLVFVALTFAPVRFVHPVRVKRWRPLTLLVAVVWLASAFVAASNNMQANGLAGIGLAASSIYLLVIGALFQLNDKMRARHTE